MSTTTSGLATLLNEVPKLDDKNWFKWKEDMTFFFLGAEVTGITDGEVPTEPAELAKWKLLDRKMTGFIRNRVTEDYRYLLKDHVRVTPEVP